MANTTTTSSVLDQTSDAAFRTWIAEIITTFTSTLTLVQTSDTGQINTSTVTRPAINVAAGYSIFRFSDSLQSTSPVFIKLEYGSGASLTTQPQMWITLGQGSNGSGTLTGNLTTRVAVSLGQVPTSVTTPFVSRFIVNMTVGYVGLVWKIAAQSTASVAQGGFRIFRSNDTSGAPTGDAICMTTNAVTAAGASSSGGNMQMYSYLTSTVYPGTLAAGVAGTWMGASGITGIPFAQSSTLVSGNTYTTPVYFMTPVIQVSAFNCIALLAEAPLGNTFTETIVGSTPHTFMSMGQPYGTTGLGQLASSALASDCWLWE